MENREKSNLFGAELEHFCSKTSAHGLSQISSCTTRKGKAFWILLFLAACIIPTVNIIGFFREYMDYPVKTEVGSVYESSLIFPSMTVCNLNNFHRSRLQNDSAMSALSVRKKSKLNCNKFYFAFVVTGEGKEFGSKAKTFMRVFSLE